jgi:hypothetical protein
MNHPGFPKEIASSTMQVLENDEEKEFIQGCLCTKRTNVCMDDTLWLFHI